MISNTIYFNGCYFIIVIGVLLFVLHCAAYIWLGHRGKVYF